MSPVWSRWTATARRPAGRSRARPADRARADLPACAERPAGIRGHRRRHRAPGPRTRPPDSDHHPQRRWMSGCRCATSKRQPRMLTHGRQCGMTGPAATWTGTRPTSSPRISRAPPGNSPGLALLRLAATAVRRRLTTVIGHGPQRQPEREPPFWTLPAALMFSMATCRSGCRYVPELGVSGLRPGPGAALAWLSPDRAVQRRMLASFTSPSASSPNRTGRG
jgi:hypothetical protein